MSYGRENDYFAGTSQGNQFLGDVCRDSSCLIIRSIKRKDISMKFESQVHRDIIQKVSVVFVDSNAMIADREKVEEGMKIIINDCNALYSAIGEHIEE